MIKTQAERVDEHYQRSKYFRKHYSVEAPILFEHTCPYPYCGGIFTADDRWFKYVTMQDGSGTFSIIHCPYCGKTFREAI